MRHCRTGIAGLNSLPILRRKVSETVDNHFLEKRYWMPKLSAKYI